MQALPRNWRLNMCELVLYSHSTCEKIIQYWFVILLLPYCLFVLWNHIWTSRVAVHQLLLLLFSVWIFLQIVVCFPCVGDQPAYGSHDDDGIRKRGWQDNDPGDNGSGNAGTLHASSLDKNLHCLEDRY